MIRGFPAQHDRSDLRFHFYNSEPEISHNVKRLERDEAVEEVVEKTCRLKREPG